MKLAIIETSMGRYFYFHFLPLLRGEIEEVKLIPSGKASVFKEKGFLIVSDIEKIADIPLKKFIKTEIVYSFSKNDVEAFKELVNEIVAREA